MPPLRILIVDDHVDTRALLSRLLRIDGHTVLTASTAGEAIAVATDNPFDLLLSDLSLPDRSGLELMREIRQLCGNVRGIALTGMEAPEYKKACEEAGFAGFLRKPLDLTTLLTEIESVRRDRNVPPPPHGKSSNDGASVD